VAETERTDPTGEKRTRRARLAARVRQEIAAISPERTRRASWVERHTVARLNQGMLERTNRWLEAVGRLTTVIYAAFIVTLVFGVDWKDAVQHLFNEGKPVKGAIALVVVLPTLIFVALHSITGYGRWRVQRELWRRDVAQMAEGIGEVAAEASRGSRP
jgi:hypothetical protein